MEEEITKKTEEDMEVLEKNKIHEGNVKKSQIKKITPKVEEIQIVFPKYFQDEDNQAEIEKIKQCEEKIIEYKFCFSHKKCYAVVTLTEKFKIPDFIRDDTVIINRVKKLVIDPIKNEIKKDMNTIDDLINETIIPLTAKQLYPSSTIHYICDDGPYKQYITSDIKSMIFAEKILTIFELLKKGRVPKSEISPYIESIIKFNEKNRLYGNSWWGFYVNGNSLRNVTKKTIEFYELKHELYDVLDKNAGKYFKNSTTSYFIRKFT